MRITLPIIMMALGLVVAPAAQAYPGFKQRQMSSETAGFKVTFPQVGATSDFLPQANITGEDRHLSYVTNWYRYSGTQISFCKYRRPSCSRNFIRHSVLMQPIYPGEEANSLIGIERQRCAQSRGVITGLGSATLGGDEHALRSLCQLGPRHQVESITATREGRIYRASIETLRQRGSRPAFTHAAGFFGSFRYLPPASPLFAVAPA